MSTEYKCPRCKAKLKESDVFCKKCGTPVKRDIDFKKKVNKYNEKVNNAKSAIKIDKEKMDTNATVVDDAVNNINEDEQIVKTRDLTLDDLKRNVSRSEKIKELALIIVILLLICSVFLNFMLYIKRNDKKCEECKLCEEKVESKKINIEGYNFTISNDWLLTIENDKVLLTDNDESLSVHLSLNNDSYDLITKNDNLKVYIEELQSKDNVFINSYKEETKNDIKYYIMEGKKDDFPYINILVDKGGKTFSATGIFENETSLSKNQEKIIETIINATKD